MRIISISAQRISSPMDEGVVINPEQTDELLLTPTRMVMPAGTSNIVKFYYHGKARFLIPWRWNPHRQE